MRHSGVLHGDWLCSSVESSFTRYLWVTRPLGPLHHSQDSVDTVCNLSTNLSIVQLFYLMYGFMWSLGFQSMLPATQHIVYKITFEQIVISQYFCTLCNWDHTRFGRTVINIFYIFLNKKHGRNCVYFTYVFVLHMWAHLLVYKPWSSFNFIFIMIVLNI